MKLKYANGNPWGNNLPDCTIRALAVALNHSYVDLCKILGKKCKKGYGMTDPDGVGPSSAWSEICLQHHLINNYESDDWVYDDDITIDDENDMYDDDDVLIDVEAGMSIFDYVRMLPPGKYIICLRPTKSTRKSGDTEWHATYYDKTTDTLYDTFNCTKGQTVHACMQINPAAVLDDDDPKSRTKELEKIRKGLK